MSLDYFTNEVEDVKSIPKGKLECMVFMSLFIGMPKITPANRDEFFERTYMYETVAGPLSTNGERITYEDVVRMTGLRTNATPFTMASFNKKIMKKLAAQSYDARKRQKDERYAV